MASRQRLIVGNWKMHKTVPEARDFVARFAELLGKQPSAEIILAPPHTALAAVAEAIRPFPIGLSAQNMHWEEQGAVTGEISPLMLKDLGCRYVILGHSERRRLLGESDEMIRKKVTAALRHDLRPILCIGETAEQRSAGETERVLSDQVMQAMGGVEKDQASGVVIAYEPVWAIGTGQCATSKQAGDVHRRIREQATGLWGQDVGQRLRILYGGSVTAENIGELLAVPDVDGALVGGACLDPVHFAKIARA